ncbi:hypothetical protein Sste5346_007122 [Sporothrix stenoceras]|uniref:prolyl oligopeptidase n=1 Tax=Sporothrix stenoceras TaxID=5173 RepID=A0ABR3YYI6_9PEZI
MDKYTFACDPVADAAATVTGPQYRFTLLGDFVLRYEWAADGVFEDRASTFALNRRFSPPKFTVNDNDIQLEIVAPKFHLRYDKKKFSANGLHVTFSFGGEKVTLWGSEWRFNNNNDKDSGNLGGTARTLDEVDGRCDVGQGILSRSGYAALDDSQSMLFDGRGFVQPRRQGDHIDGYLFFYGRDYAGAMRAFYSISGPQPRIPRWALGNWWSRFHRYSAASYLELMDRFGEEKIPLSVAVIDMDWHLVDDERVPHAGWTGYTWDRTLFPDPVAFAKELHNRHLKTTLNDHPHLGVHHHEESYKKMAEALGRDPSTKLPIAFDLTDPKFMDAWLNVLHRDLEKQGCDFWWIDWQQGALSRVPGLDPLWLLNHFHFLDNQQQSTDDHGLIFSRFAGPGSHRYPVGFSGDSITTWASLQFQPEFTATAANVGYGWWSHDIGGHMHGYRDDELATRWLQFGVFSPVMRLHASNSPWSSKEPWLFRPEFSTVMRRAMQLRHRLVPYVYASAGDGLPLVQPMYWSHPTRDEAYAYPNQYMFGPALIVSPVVDKRDARTGRAKTRVWLPPQRHVDLFTGTVYDGDCELDMYRTINTVPVLAPEGAIVPLDGDLTPANGCHNPTSLEVLVVIGHDGHFCLVEDPRDDPLDGADRDVSTTKDRTIDIDFCQATGQLTLTADGDVKKQWTFRFVSLQTPDKMPAVSVDGVPLPEEDIVVKVDDNKENSSPPGLVVTLPAKRCKAITVDIGPDPQLAIRDHRETISAMLLDLQAEFSVKDAVWKVVTSSSSTGIKLGQLFSLGLDEALVGPVVEPIKPDAEYDWLEAATAPECLTWAAAETKLATDHLDALPQKKSVEDRLRELLAQESAPAERQLAGNGKLFRLQKTPTNPLGVFEMTVMNSDGSASGEWRTVIDIGALSKAEGKSYIFVDFDLQSRVLGGDDATRVLLYLSDGGSDLVEVVEVELKEGESAGGLLAGGFRAGPDRLAVCYLGPDHILIQTSVTNGLKTKAGMPCTAFIWQRGTDLREAKEVYTAPATDAISLLTSVGPPEEGRGIITRAIDYTTWAHYSVTLDGTVKELPLPRKQCLLVPPRTTAEHLVVSLVDNAIVRGVEVPAGSILACTVDPDVPEDEKVSVVFAPGDNEYTPHIVADGVQASRSRVMFTATKDGQERRQLMQWDKASRTWSELRRTPIDPGSHYSLLGGDYYAENFVVSESGLLRPTVSWVEAEDGGRANFYTQPAVFDVDKFQLQQSSAISKDGTSVDYVLLAPKDAPKPTPTLVTAYGVMGISMMMRHLDPILGGVSLVPWLESGGALAVALVRGGSEKGPAWHEAAQGGNRRQKSYDDFVAVAEKLVADKVTEPAHMGVFGASGGGLLAAVMAVQRPDLFGAVVADVPMTDMLRFPLLGMGGAWIAEYGDPSDPTQVEAIKAYSPLHNIVDDNAAVYPPQLVTVSTKDDRVGVGHARKYVAKIKDAGAPDIWLHEDSAGGHNVSDSFKNAQLMSRRVAFLINRLQVKASSATPSGSSRACSTTTSWPLRSFISAAKTSRPAPEIQDMIAQTLGDRLAPRHAVAAKTWHGIQHAYRGVQDATFARTDSYQQCLSASEGYAWPVRFSCEPAPPPDWHDTDDDPDDDGPP